MENSGGALHVEMVKKASKALIDRFNTLNTISLEYEGHLGARINMAIDRLDKVPAIESLDFRPDIIVRHVPETEKGLNSYQLMEVRDRKKWTKIEDSQFIIFEIETNPSNILRNTLKMVFYEKLKNSETQWGRAMYAFVLVAPAKYEAEISIFFGKASQVFDEVWLFDENGGLSIMAQNAKEEI